MTNAELNVAVAKRVMRWERINVKGAPHWRIPGTATAFREEDLRFATDPVWSKKVVEALAARGFTLRKLQAGDELVVTFADGPREFPAIDMDDERPSVDRLICLAALSAIKG